MRRSPYKYEARIASNSWLWQHHVVNSSRIEVVFISTWFCVYIRFRLKLWRLQSINQRSLEAAVTGLSRVSLTLSIFWKPIMTCQPEIHLSVLAHKEHRVCSDRETLTWKPRIEGGTHINDTLTTRRDCFTEFNRSSDLVLHCILRSLLFIFAHLLPELELYSDWRWWSTHDVSRIWWIVGRRFKDKLEDSSVVRGALSPGEVIINWTGDDMKRDNNYTNIN